MEEENLRVGTCATTLATPKAIFFSNSRRVLRMNSNGNSSGRSNYQDGRDLVQSANESQGWDTTRRLASRRDKERYLETRKERQNNR